MFKLKNDYHLNFGGRMAFFIQLIQIDFGVLFSFKAVPSFFYFGGFVNFTLIAG